MLEEVNKLLAGVRRKIFLLIGRAILTAVDASKKTTTIQVTGLSGETITGVEKIDEYGFASNPPVDDSSEVVIAFINGNRDQGLALKVHHRDSKPIDLSSGEVRVYDNNDNKITLTAEGIEIVDKNGNEILYTSTGIQLKTGDASAWAPNVMKTCPLTGIPHGGNVAGIVKLTGG